MGRLTEAVRTGTNQSVATLGYEQFDYYARNPAEACNRDLQTWIIAVPCAGWY